MGANASHRARMATELNALLDHFIDGDDISLAAAGRLEMLLDDTFPDDEIVQDLVSDLARYRPGGGDFLLDADEMHLRLRRLRDHLQRYAT